MSPAVFYIINALYDVMTLSSDQRYEVFRWLIWSLFVVLLILSYYLHIRPAQALRYLKYLTFVGTTLMFCGVALGHVPLPKPIDKAIEWSVGKPAEDGGNDQPPSVSNARSHLKLARQHYENRKHPKDALPELDKFFNVVKSGLASELSVGEIALAYFIKAACQYHKKGSLDEVNSNLKVAVQCGHQLDSTWAGRFSDLQVLQRLKVRPTTMGEFEYYGSKAIAVLSLSRDATEYEQVMDLLNQALACPHTPAQLAALKRTCLNLHISDQARRLIANI
ncbi:MAG: hypothetical protein KAW46_06610 [candidate division Zixibacteria bacterium]|nr:hypothetical protein [candidate division Zixibacteria bacterium]